MSQQTITPLKAVDVDTTSLTPAKTEVLSTGARETARRYAEEHGLAVFPCRAGQKTPATTNGFKAATKEPDKIGSMFNATHNVAVRTGAESGVFVLDVDEPGGDASSGGESLAALELIHGPLPDTVTATTPRGGKHYYFRWPSDAEVKNSTSKVGDKLDIRGEGGYVVAPPSKTGAGAYVWVTDRGPGEIPIAEAPDWLVRLATGGSAPPTESRGSAAEIAIDSADDIPEGSRNATLTSRGGAMRRQGFDEAAIAAALLAENAARCKPPLDADEVQRIAKSVARYNPESGADLGDAALPYRDFPVEELPKPIAELVAIGAEAIGCDASYIALPLLAGLASAIGNSCRIKLKESWEEPSILWTAIVGDSGTMKSPAIRLALKPVRDRQQSALAAHKFVLADYQAKTARYEREQAAWKRSNSEGDPPTQPIEPTARRTWADDLTVEALATLLLEQPRGLLVARDELANWFAGFDRYAQASGGDAARWLEMHGGGQIVVDRKTGEPKTICVPRAAVSVTGGIQPAVLDRALGRNLRDNGMAARLLLAYPPRKPKKWTETEVDPAIERRVAEVYERLYGLGEVEGGELTPRVLTLSDQAKREWVSFYNEHAQEQARLDGDLAAAYSKLEGCCARIALVLHLAAWAAGTHPEPEPVRLESVRRARRVIEWFKYEIRRIYAVLGAGEDARQDLRLLEKIRRQSGRATPRDVMRWFPRDWPRAEVAEKALNDLADRGLGEWKVDTPRAPGGRPSRVLELKD